MMVAILLMMMRIRDGGGGDNRERQICVVNEETESLYTNIALRVSPFIERPSRMHNNFYTSALDK